MLATLLLPFAFSQAAPPTTPSEISSVVVYPDGARVTRSASVDVPEGDSSIRIDGLPAQSLRGAPPRARVTGATIVSIQQSTHELPDATATQQAARLDGLIRGLEDSLAAEEDALAALALETKLVETVSVRVGEDANKAGGTAALDLGALAKQVEWVRTERLRLGKAAIEQRRRIEAVRKELDAARQNRGQLGGSRTVGSIDLVLRAEEPGTVEIAVEYAVGNATWEPSYSLRADPGAEKAVLEYEAKVRQSTGEDWPAVPMTLSTAEVVGDIAPRPVEPWFVDVYVPPPASEPAYGFGGGGFRGAYAIDAPAAPAPMEADKAGLADAAEEEWESLGRRVAAKSVAPMRRRATLRDLGPAVAFVLPSPLAVASKANDATTVRITEIDSPASYMRQAQPLVDEKVYLRGTFVNTGAFAMLPAEVGLFLGGEFVGTTNIGKAIPPAQEFDLFLGQDRSVQASREIVKKETASAGFLGGDTGITWNYRIRIVNGTSKPVAIELFDRMPVSRNEKITVKLTDPAPALAKDAEYLQDLAPKGILKWLLTVPSTPAGQLGTPVTWTVEVRHGKAIQTTPLPD